jgi:hypothetical protein
LGVERVEVGSETKKANFYFSDEPLDVAYGYLMMAYLDQQPIGGCLTYTHDTLHAKQPQS